MVRAVPPGVDRGDASGLRLHQPGTSATEVRDLAAAGVQGSHRVHARPPEGDGVRPVGETLRRQLGATMRIVRTKHEQALRDAIHQLLADGYDWGLLCGLCLDAMGVLEVIDPERKMPRRRRRQKSEGNSSKFPS